MKIGIDTFSFQVLLEAGHYDIFRTLDSLEEQGLRGLQININGPQGRFLGADPSDKRQVRQVRQSVEKKGFFVEIGGRSTDPKMLEWQLHLCADLGADTLRTCVIYEKTLKNTLEDNQRNLEKILPLAESLGIFIALENHEDITAAELCILLEAMDHPFLKACLDSGNDLSIFGDPVDAARALAPWAKTTHLKDQKLIRVGQEIFSVGIPLGQGDINLPTILEIIRRDSSLDRILIQDTWGYAAPLNPFGRKDLQPTRDYSQVPGFADLEAAEANGFFLNWKDLEPDMLQDLAQKKDSAIARDIQFLRDALNT